MSASHRSVMFSSPRCMERTNEFDAGRAGCRPPPEHAGFGWLAMPLGGSIALNTLLNKDKVRLGFTILRTECSF